MTRKTQRLLFLVTILAISAAGLVYQSATLHARSFLPEGISARTQKQAYLRTLNSVIPEIRQISDTQTANSLSVVNEQEMQSKIASIRLHIMRSNFSEAQKELRDLRANSATWKATVGKAVEEQKLQQAAAAAAASAAAATAAIPSQKASAGLAGKSIPILTYHYTPGDFESQLIYLRDRGYTPITMTEAANAILLGTALPAKPVVITYDDGYTDQMKAFALLQKYNMKATYYLITGGEASKWCIGIERRYDQGYGCGDQYLSWDAVRTLDQSGLIEIGGHTVDHLALAAQPFAVQKAQIADNKAAIESHLGHAIHHFAYPYGSYNASAVEAVRQSGYTTAVTTLPGTIQSASKILTLYRITNIRTLP